MERKTLIILAGAVAVLMAVVGFAGTSGLPGALEAQGEAEIRNLSEAKDTFERHERVVTGALESEPGLFSARGFDQTWPSRLRGATQRLEQAFAQKTELEKLLDADDPDDAPKVQELLGRIRAARSFAVGEAAEMARVAQRRLDFKRRRPEMVEEMKRDRDAIAAVALEPLQAKVTRAANDWPGKKDDLERRLQTVTAAKASAESTWNTVTEENGKAEEDIDYDRLIEAGNHLRELRANADAVATSVPELVEQLYWSWEKILADMEIREGAEVTFHHQIKTVKVHLLDAGENTNEATESETWVRVPEARYKALEKNLGMSLERKPAGKYDVEAERLTQPPGYAFMASPEQGRNRYGYWDRRSNGSFWVWYGQYSLMRDLLYGGRGYYQPIPASDWRGYETARSRGSTYYGRDSAGQPVHGSDGSRTRTRYATSRYVRSGGYKSTRYKQSGGTYRGSRYATSSRGRTSSGGRSRFGGGK